MGGPGPPFPADFGGSRSPGRADKYIFVSPLKGRLRFGFGLGTSVRKFRAAAVMCCDAPYKIRARSQAGGTEFIRLSLLFRPSEISILRVADFWKVFCIFSLRFDRWVCLGGSGVACSGRFRPIWGVPGVRAGIQQIYLFNSFHNVPDVSTHF